MVTHSLVVCCSIFFFNDTATTESYTYVHTPSTTLFRSISEGWSRARQPGSSGRVGPTATCGGARPSAHQALVSSSRTGCCQPPARGGRSCRTPEAASTVPSLPCFPTRHLRPPSRLGRRRNNDIVSYNGGARRGDRKSTRLNSSH